MREIVAEVTSALAGQAGVRAVRLVGHVANGWHNGEHVRSCAGRGKGGRMARARKESLRLVSVAEQARLERIVSASSERVDRVRRATALLAVLQGRVVCAGRRAGRLPQPKHRGGARRAVQPTWPWSGGHCGRARSHPDLRLRRARTDRGDRPAAAREEGGWDGHLVAGHA